MQRVHGWRWRSRSRVASVLSLLTWPSLLIAQGTIVGTVRDSLGSAVSGARVTVDSSATRAVTDPSGDFRLATVAAGNVDIQVHRLGYRPASRQVRVESGSVVRVDLLLVALPLRLPTVEVRRKPEPYDSRLAGFNARKERKAGRFVTRDQLDRMSSARFVDALRQIPGVQLRALRGGGTTIMLRGSRCPPLVFIDGNPADAGVMDLDMIDLSGVEGIEIYSGAASVPSEFMGARGMDGCGVVAIWSRPARPRPRRIEAGEVDFEKLLASSAVYTSAQVDVPARLASGSGIPVYPDSLWRAGVPGRVVVEFIVDAEGSIEDGSLRVVSSTHTHFSSAVTAALGFAEFRPATLQGKPVRQIVQLPVVFSMQPSDTVRSPQ